MYASLLLRKLGSNEKKDKFQVLIGSEK